MEKIIKKFVASDIDVKLARLFVVIVLAVMGNYKWFEFEVEALKPLFSSTWLSFLPSVLGYHGASYFLGINGTPMMSSIARWPNIPKRYARLAPPSTSTWPWIYRRNATVAGLMTRPSCRISASSLVVQKSQVLSFDNFKVNKPLEFVK